MLYSFRHFLSKSPDPGLDDTICLIPFWFERNFKDTIIRQKINPNLFSCYFVFVCIECAAIMVHWPNRVDSANLSPFITLSVCYTKNVSDKKKSNMYVKIVQCTYMYRTFMCTSVSYFIECTMYFYVYECIVYSTECVTFCITDKKILWFLETLVFGAQII